MMRNISWGVWFTALLLLVILFGPWLAPHDPNLVDLSKRLQPPGAEHWFGTDQLGRDMLSRILTGGQTTVGISMAALGLAILVGVPVGLLAGYWGGRVDWALMRLVDAFMAFPEYIVAIVISGLLGAGFLNLMFAILVVKWVGYARLVRSVVLQEKSKDYLLVAKISGAGAVTTLRRHLIPHVLGPVLALATLDIGKVILLVAALSYIGLGVQPPHPEWGSMLNEGRAYFTRDAYLMIVPGLSIFVVVFVMNLLGNRLVAKFGSDRQGEADNGITECS
ncbi:ABC transporter permease subunit|uniref:Peptide/nickel transport system permease protein n=1 Tax=Dendrosporobacter quercicolus TaxID=146817 RepID=A0A1G9QVE2_9FIRM|nr:nickel transporter permease [Dendrosporobacter quercicolus]NSL48377.1 ABC transporter permease subunit [Dendrosporobacter quercicolus DSM 1736]SDM14913.1 peptide/nickel transport system permease protein [Dendrosporobacter quercicolus]